MAAPIGNEFWKKRSKHGRDKIFSSPEILKEACEEYFQWTEENPLIEMKPFAYQGEITYAKIEKMRAMTISALCIFLDINTDTWYEYKERKDFSEICREVEEVIRTQKFQGASADLLNASIIARDLGLKDTKDHTSSDGSMTPKPAANIDASKLSDAVIKELLKAKKED